MRIFLESPVGMRGMRGMLLRLVVFYFSLLCTLYYCTLLSTCTYRADARISELQSTYDSGDNMVL